MYKKLVKMVVLTNTTLYLRNWREKEGDRSGYKVVSLIGAFGGVLGII